MKKISFLIAGLLISGVASAVQLTTSGQVRMTDCALLNEDVQINVTSGVVAGVGCNARAIAITTCHTAGRTTSRTVNVCANTDGDPNTGVGGNEDCTQTQTTTGPAVASATTLAGTVTPQYPGGTCSAGTAETQAQSNLPTEE
ncbi:hypothetical protein [Azoarcus olearius]|uniref:PilB n=1 Tax=Azoarcus sp. (strain BH72) TaxID=418699 RepID=O85010_AZOSB|nr:hypothetical protein [Azoarcus olearius]AAC27899.1 PilB [Azoarcus olearius]CAL95970.1 Type IV pilus assembly protein [Azoarcus olearius]